MQYRKLREQKDPQGRDAATPAKKGTPTASKRLQVHLSSDRACHSSSRGGRGGGRGALTRRARGCSGGTRRLSVNNSNAVR